MRPKSRLMTAFKVAAFPFAAALAFVAVPVLITWSVMFDSDDFDGLA